MADRYWVGNSGNWSDTNRWSASSGGSSGASVPTAVDNVYFDALSFDASSTVALDASAFCLDLNWENINASVWFTSSAINIYVYGNVILSPHLSVIFTGNKGTNSPIGGLFLRATDTRIIKTNGCTPDFNGMMFDSSTGVWHNADDCSMRTTQIYLNLGTWDTSRYMIKAGRCSIPTGTNLTPRIFRFNDSSLYFTEFIITGGTTNYNTVTPNFANSTIYTTLFNLGGIRYINYGNIYANRFTGYLAGSYRTLSLVSNVRETLNVQFHNFDTSINTFIVQGYEASANRAFFYNFNINTRRTITAADVSFANVDFRDIQVAGPANWDLSNIPGGAGDCGNNVGITFTPPTSCFFKTTTSTSYWSNINAWRTESNGNTTSRVPLAQDIAIFDQNSFTQNSSVYLDAPRISSLITSQVDVSLLLRLQQSTNIYGDLKLNKNTSFFSDTFSLNFYGDNSTNQIKIIDASNAYIPKSFTVHVGQYNLNSDLKLEPDNILRINGIWNTNNFNITTGYVTFINSIIPTTNYMGNGTWELTGTADTVQHFFYGTIFPGNSTILLNPASTVTNITFAGGGKTYNNIRFSGQSNSFFNVTGNNIFNKVTIDPGRKVKFGALQQTTFLDKFIASGTPTNMISLSTTTDGSIHMINASTNNNFKIQTDFCLVRDLSVGPANKWFAQNSVNSSGNTGLNFARYETKRLRVKNTPINLGTAKTYTSSPQINILELLGLNAVSGELIGDDYIRITYDFTDDNQLLDFEPRGTSVSITRDATNNRAIVSGTGGNIRAMLWKQPIKCHKIAVTDYISPTGGSRYINVYSQVDYSWAAAATWAPNPGLGIIWYDAETNLVFTRNGGTQYINIGGGTRAGTPVYDVPGDWDFYYYDNQFYSYAHTDDVSGAQVFNIASIRTKNTYSAFGAWNNNSHWGGIVIEGEIDL